MSQTENLLKGTKNCTLAVNARIDGSVESVAGTGDGEGLAAVGAITSQAIETACEKLGLGRAVGWTAAGGDVAVRVAMHGASIDAALISSDDNMFRGLDDFVELSAKTKP